MRIRYTVLLLLLMMLPVGAAAAQSVEPELQLQLRRTFGYQAGDRIQGSFSLRVSGIEDLASVVYLIDDEILATVSEDPFRASFSTATYAPGNHALQAIAVRLNGDQLESQVIRVTFITAEQSWQSAGRITVWILVGAVGLMLAGGLTTGLLTRQGRKFEPGLYGTAGGAVCGRCRLPFSRHVLAPNLLIGKLERCPHCGRVAIVARASIQALEAAEARYREDQLKGQRTVHPKEEDYRQRLDDSRFEG